jgi:D-serine deaminase-like pyridoxal phosphate-dependent protein
MSRIPGDASISRPTMVLDVPRVRANISYMAGKASAAGIGFRPHFKTHQSAVIGEWFRAEGVTSITVSSLDMAEQFADAGWTDILVAFPVNLREISRIRQLARRIDLGLMVDMEKSAVELERELADQVKIWIKIDAGYGRVGIPWNQPEVIARLARILNESDRFNYQGIMAHSGHSYHAATVKEIQRIHAESIFRMRTVCEELASTGLGRCLISLGDTPTCSIADSFPGVDEIRPGNFVFHDLMQRALGACEESQIAVAVACPIVGLYPEQGKIAIYGGAIHFSKEYITDRHGRVIFGYLTEVDLHGLGAIREDLPLISLSQEHGIVEAEGDLIRRLRVGDLIYIYPVHSCLTCNLHRGYRTLEGEFIPRNGGTDHDGLSGGQVSADGE